MTLPLETARLVTAAVFAAVFVAGAGVVVFSGRLALARSRRSRSAAWRLLGARRRLRGQVGVQAMAAVAGAAVGWVATGLVGMSVLLGGLGVLLPPFVAAPARRRRQSAEASAWSVWCRQMASLAQAGSGLADAVSASVDHAPEPIAAVISEVAVRARADGLEAALERLGRSGAVWEPEVAAGLRMAAASGSGIAGPLVDLSGRIDDAVSMHRVRTEAVVQLWAQTIALLVVAAGVVALMYRNNAAYFAPYSTSAGQSVLALIAAVLLGSVSLLVYHSTARPAPSVLAEARGRGRARYPL